jgi:glycosyltransferase involved in cell wall biosynthesis
MPEKIFWVLKGYAKRITELFKLKQYDIVYIFLWVTPFGMPLLERLFTRVNPHVVYDIDDAIFMKAQSMANNYANFIKGRSKPFFMMKNARHVIACTPYLTDVAKRYNDNVSDISSSINTNTYRVVNTYQNDHKLILGWSGSHSTIQFLYLLKNVLIQINKTHPFKLLVMGDTEFKIEGLDIEAISWTAEKEISTLQKFDIGLYPLPIDNDWVLGKSGLKALQYMAVGVPVVATAIGANFRIMEDGKTGFLIKREEEWIEKIILLMKDPGLRKKMGEAGRKNVETYYSIEAIAPMYRKILESVCR